MATANNIGQKDISSRANHRKQSILSLWKHNNKINQNHNVSRCSKHSENSSFRSLLNSQKSPNNDYSNFFAFHQKMMKQKVGQNRYLQNSYKPIQLSQFNGEKDVSTCLIVRGDCTRKALIAMDIENRINKLEEKLNHGKFDGEQLNAIGKEIYQKFNEYYLQKEWTKKQENYLVNKIPLITYSYKQQSQVEEIKANMSDKTKDKTERDILSKKVKTLGQLESQQELKWSETEWSIVSISGVTNNEQGKRTIQLELGEDEIDGLDREVARRMSEIQQTENERFIELKQNVRIMEERIGAITRKLQELKAQLNIKKNECTEVKEIADKIVLQNQRLNQRIASLKEQKLKFQQNNRILVQRIKQLQQDKKQFVAQIKRFEKIDSNHREEIRFLSLELRQREKNEERLEQCLNRRQIELMQKNQEFKEILDQLKDHCCKLKNELKEKQIEIREMRQTTKDLKERVQTQGINLKFQQASRLKQIIEESEARQDAQIQNILRSHQQVISLYEKQLKNMSEQKHKIELAMLDVIGSLDLHEQVDQANAIFKFHSIIEKGKEWEIKWKEQNQSRKRLQYRLQILNDHFLQTENQLNEKVEKFQYLSSKLQQKQFDTKIYLAEVEEQRNGLRFMVDQYQKKQQHKKQHLKLALAHSICASQPQKQQQNILLSEWMSRKGKNPKDILLVSIKLIQLALQLGSAKKKLPRLRPKNIEMSWGKNLQMNLISSNNQQQQEESLIYGAPQVLLGFSETVSSYVWSIGIIIDELTHNKIFYRRFEEILIRTDNYIVRNEQLQWGGVLKEMIRKNQKLRLGLKDALAQLKRYQSIALLQ